MEPSSAQRIGGPVAEYSLPQLDGDACTLRDELDGKRGAVVVFWSGICTHCVRYDGYLNNFTTRHPELGLIAIASRVGETIEQIRAARSERRLTFPILCDPNAAVARVWCTQQTPRAFLVDAAGVLLYRGAIDNFLYSEDPEYQAYLEPAVESFLNSRPIERSETASFGCAIQSVYYILPKALRTEGGT